MPVPFQILGSWPGAVVTVQAPPDHESYRLPQTRVPGQFAYSGFAEEGDEVFVHVHRDGAGELITVRVPAGGGDIDLTPEPVVIEVPVLVQAARDAVSGLTEGGAVRRAIEALADALEALEAR